MARPKSLTTRAIFPVRLSAMEKELIEARAVEAGVTASEYMRRCALGKRLHSKVNVKAMAELSRLGGLQKLCIMHSPEHRAALNEVIADILLTLKSIRQSGS
jgi:hypothetical protein